MKLFFIVFLSTVSLASITACQKCRSCTYYEQYGTQVSTQQEVQTCDKKKDLNEWEMDALQSAQAEVSFLGGKIVEFSCQDE